jgi:hypothetical protein
MTKVRRRDFTRAVPGQKHQLVFLRVSVVNLALDLRDPRDLRE